MADKHPTPWRLELDEAWPEFTDCPIRDANGDPVVQTDSGCYPPDNETAALIVEAVNEHVARHRMIDISTYDHICTENDRLRDLVRRLADELGDAIEEAVGEWESNLEAEWEEPDFTTAKALLREAREAVGEEVSE